MQEAQVEVAVAVAAEAPETTPEVVEIKEEAPAVEKQPEPETQERDESGRFKPKVQQRIDEITRARHEAEREAAYWRARAEASGTDSKAQSNPSETTPPKPTIDKFQDYADYVEALTDWKAEQATRKAIAERDAASAREAEAKLKDAKAQTWEQRQAQTRSAIPDYDEVLGMSNLRIAQHVVEVLMDSDDGPALAYHFAKNPDVAERINSMSPLAAAREIGRLESSLQKPVVPPVNISKAPPPIAPVGTRATPSADPDKMSTDDWLKWRNSQLQKRR